MNRRRVLVHADVELSAIDGSTSWLISVSRAFALAGAEVDVMARNVPTRAIVLDELRKSRGVTVVFPNAASINDAATVAAAIVDRHEGNPYDMIVIRGETIALKLVRSRRVDGVLWSYIAGLPKVFDSSSPAALSNHREIAVRARGLFAQTVWLRDYLNAVVPESTGKTEVLPPMVPDEFFATDAISRPGPLRMGYAGKFDQPWHTLEIPELVDALRQRGIPTHLVMHGDKVQASKRDPKWHVRMRRLMTDPPTDVHFPGAIRRSDMPAFMATCDVGLGWRDAALDASYEISTKLLEFSATGVPVVCNDTAIHRSMFGADYPLFVRDDLSTVVDRLATWVRMGGPNRELSQHVRRVASSYSVDATATRLRALLDRVTSMPAGSGRQPASSVYVHLETARSGRLAEALSSIGIGAVEALPARSTKAIKSVMARTDVIVVDFDRRSLAAVADAGQVPVVAVATGARAELGLASAFHTSRLAGLVAPDRELISRVRRVSPRCRTLELDPDLLVRSLSHDSSMDASRYVSIVVDQSEPRSIADLDAAVARAMRAAADLCGVRVVILQGNRGRPPVDSRTTARLARQVHHAVSRFGESQLEILGVAEGDPRWVRDTALLMSLTSGETTSALIKQVSAYGGSVLGRPSVGGLPSEGISWFGEMSATAVSEALVRRAQAEVAADRGGTLDRFAAFVRSIVADRSS